MSIKSEALDLIGELPDDCTWLDVLHAAAARAGGRLVALARSPEEMAALHGEPEAAPEIEFGGWCVGPIPIDLSHAPPPLAEMMIRVRDAVARCLEDAPFPPTRPEPDPRKMN